MGDLTRLHLEPLAPASLTGDFGGFAFYDGYVTALSVGHFILDCVLSGR